MHARTRHRWLLVAAIGFGAMVAAEEPMAEREPNRLIITRRADKKTDKDRDEKDKNGKNDDEKEEEKKPEWKAWKPEGRALTLGECLAIGQEKQPAIKAAVASLAASERGYLALFGLRKIADIFSPDLPFRRQQSQRGLAAATAEVLKARQENTYDIARLYYSYVYATQQEQTAAEIVEFMETSYDSAVEILKSDIVDPKIKVNEFTLGRLDDIIGEVRDLRGKATNGRKNALVALKEAMGVPQEEAIYPSAKELPLMKGEATLEQVLALARNLRPELVQASVVVDVTRLEVCAQAAVSRRNVVSTFASGTDLHARILPSPMRNGGYRPGAIPPEMPIQFVGTKDDRVSRAQAFVARQEAFAAKSIGLVDAEAAKAYLDYAVAAERIPDATARHERAQKLVEKARTAAATKMDPELLVTNESLASRAQSKYVEAVYEHILALITLEKVTAGGVKPAFPDR